MKAQKQLTKLRWDKRQNYAKNVHVSFPMSRLEFFDMIYYLWYYVRRAWIQKDYKAGRWT